MAEEIRAAAPAEVRALLERAASAHTAIGELRAGEDELHAAVRTAYQASHASAVRGRLVAIPIDRLRDVTGARLPVGRLAEAGYETVADLVDVSAETLKQLPGIGVTGAERTVEAVQRIAAAAEQTTGVTADMDLRGPDAAALLSSLYRARVADRVLERVREPAARLGGAVASLAATAKPLGGRVRRMFLRRPRREEAQRAATELGGLLEDPRTVRDLDRIDAANKRLRAKPPRPATARSDFEKHSADYFSTLSRIVGARERPEAARGYLTDDLAARISAQRLDETHLRVSLRGYQAFGAQFALVQQRSILGDEMGLGKTIEALAVLATCAAEGGSGTSWSSARPACW